MTTTGVPDILKEIVDVKRVEGERLKLDQPLSALERRIDAQDSPRSLSDALTGTSVRIIAEVKKASPSKGLLRTDFDPVAIATEYIDNGAAAISVLTNADHFQGHIDHMASVRELAGPKGVPVLRKEFVFDPYQVYEARAYGADAILLIVAMLAPNSLSDLGELARKLGMQVLVEVHDEEEVKVALDTGAEIVGINNRDLRTFKTDLGVTLRLASKIPKEKTIVSESGIRNRDDIRAIQEAGANAALIGESLVTARDIGAKLQEFV